MKYEPLIEDNYYHIYNCGNNKEDIFIEEENYTYFLKLIKKYILTVSKVLSYCLLKNHFHLLIKTKPNVESKVISQAFSNLFNAYSKAINKRYNRTGSLFKDRFQRIKISDEDYLKSLIIYINTNPVHHSFTDIFESYPFSSYQSLISNQPTHLNREFVIDLFENTANFKAVHYQKQDLLENLKLE